MIGKTVDLVSSVGRAPSVQAGVIGSSPASGTLVPH